MLCFEDLDDRPSWAPHGVEGFNVAPAPEHYRYNKVFIPSTCDTRISNMVVFFSPPDYMLPEAPSEEEKVMQTARGG